MAKPSIRLVGVPGVKKALGVIQVKAKPLAEVAMKICVLQVKRDSMEVTPVLTGALKASHDSTVTSKGSFTVQGIVFVTAGYAIYVHENLEAQHKEGKTAKFLEKSLRQNRPFILDTFQTMFKGL